jgi:hypothetical protein
MDSIFEILKKSHNVAVEACESLQFDKEHPWHRNLVALHCSMIELTGCMIILLKGNGKAGVPSIFRSILETYVELKNLLNERTYGFHMEAIYLEQWLKLLKEAKKGNPYLSSIANTPDFDATIQRHEKELHDLKKRNYGPLLVSARFSRCGMEDVYKSLYNMLCNHDHPNIRALIDRHIELEKDGFYMVLYKGQSLEDFESYILHCCTLLNSSGCELHKLLNSNAVAKIEELTRLTEGWVKNHLTSGCTGEENSQ